MPFDINYSGLHWKIFAGNLYEAFIRLGFEVYEKPYFDNALLGFRATYIRRYLFHNHTVDGSMTSIIHLVGLPFGNQSQKMIVLASPRTIDNEPICNTIKLRIQIDDEGIISIVQSDQSTNININGKKVHTNDGRSYKVNEDDRCIMRGESSKVTVLRQPNSSLGRQQMDFDYSTNCLMDYLNEATVGTKTNHQLTRDLFGYVSHIIEMISPGLIELPIDVKFEILKRLSVASVIRMSQVNNEFKSLIIKHGESLWRHLCLRDFNIRVINRRRHRSWMELYKEAYLLQQIEICRKERALPGLPDRPALPPVPDRLQIEWLPGVLELPFIPLEVDEMMQPMALALQLPPMMRAESFHDLLHDNH